MQRFCTHDGPGIRTTIFMKGCPLRCAWCSNPESQHAMPQTLYYGHLCKHCGKCVESCRHGAIRRENEAIVYDRSKCRDCGNCAAVCPYGARSHIGREATVEEIVDFARQDWRYYMQSGGGVTCGGGEALAQADFVGAIFKRLHDELGYHTCLDTSGHAPWEVLEPLLPVTDLILLDIKHMDSRSHKNLTGVDNGLILSNAERLGARRFPVIVRVPLIPGFNDHPVNICSLGKFLAKTGLNKVELMPYHTYGRSKYLALGREYDDFEGEPDVDGAVERLRRMGCDVTVQGR